MALGTATTTRMMADLRKARPLRIRPAKAVFWMKKLPRLPTIMLGITFLAILIGPAIVPHDPLQPNPANVLDAPSGSHWFGTDGFGMDVFSRVIAAARLDVGVAVAGVTVGVVGGSILGATVAYTGGWLDAVVQKGIEVLQSFPLFLFALALFAVLGDNTFNLVVVMASISLPWYARVVRSVIAPLREAEFVKALQNAGASGPRIVVMELLPNATSQVLGLFALSTALAIQVIAALAFIGLGVKPPFPEWGSMINTGAPFLLQGAWWVSTFPGVAVVLVVFSLYSLARFFDTETRGIA